VAGDSGALAKQPIPPSFIVSSSFQGVALMQYDAKGEDELSMRKDEQLRVLCVLLVRDSSPLLIPGWFGYSKRYAHWSYSVKETGERGWVPSWFVGKSAAGKESGPPIMDRLSILLAQAKEAQRVRPAIRQVPQSLSMGLSRATRLGRTRRSGHWGDRLDTISSCVYTFG
jgi:hypothetical protein